MAVDVRRVLSDSAILLANCFIKYRTSTVSGPGSERGRCEGRGEEYGEVVKGRKDIVKW